MEHVPPRAVAWCQRKLAFHLGNLFWLLQPPRLITMVLRCLLFASDEATAQSLWRVITELGMEGEHCRNALEAVERLTNHPFHIVIADWDDEPEASFLLKTARELKATERPLTLAIIKDEATVPKALQAGYPGQAPPWRPPQPRRSRRITGFALENSCSLRPPV